MPSKLSKAYYHIGKAFGPHLILHHILDRTEMPVFPVGHSGYLEDIVNGNHEAMQTKDDVSPKKVAVEVLVSTSAAMLEMSTWAQ